MSFWRKQSKLKNYVSELDQFLQEFDLKPEASSLSRQAEEHKAEWVSKRRDNPNAEKSTMKIWEDFQNE